MRIKNFLIQCCLFLFPTCYSAHKLEEKSCIVLDTLESRSIFQETISRGIFISEQDNFFTGKRPSPLLRLFHLKQNKNKKITAAILAFPLPFGIVGLHRIYLGCAPYVPVVYIASFGGVLGLLPLIDFCFILLDKDLAAYENNKKVFMWIK